MPTLAAPVATHITLDDQGRPCIEGTGVKVIEVVMDHLGWKMDAAQIHDMYPDLPLSKIHAALSYYYDHKEELDTEVGRICRDADAMRQAQASAPWIKRILSMREKGQNP